MAGYVAVASPVEGYTLKAVMPTNVSVERRYAQPTATSGSPIHISIGLFDGVCQLATLWCGLDRLHSVFDRTDASCQHARWGASDHGIGDISRSSPPYRLSPDVKNVAPTGNTGGHLLSHNGHSNDGVAIRTGGATSPPNQEENIP
jgi:hypothetical protein